MHNTRAGGARRAAPFCPLSTIADDVLCIEYVCHPVILPIVPQVRSPYKDGRIKPLRG